MTNTQPCGDPSAQHSAPLPEVATPFSARELGTALYLPHRAMDMVLTDRQRWLATVGQRSLVARLLTVTLVVGCVFSLPYGMLLGAERFWQVAALYLGSVLICFPSLHVFSAFLGVRVGLGQSLSLAVLISAVAAIFTFGFFPIVWFLSATMTHKSSAGTLQVISTVLLTVSLGAGLIQLGRCLRAGTLLQQGRTLPVLIIFWQVLLVFITYRMGLHLGIV